MKKSTAIPNFFTIILIFVIMVFPKISLGWERDSLTTEHQKSVLGASLVSIALPGLGHYYVEEYKKGTILAVLGFGGMALSATAVALSSQDENHDTDYNHDETNYLSKVNSDRHRGRFWGEGRNFTDTEKAIFITGIVLSIGTRLYSVFDAAHAANSYNKKLKTSGGLGLKINGNSVQLAYSINF